MKEDYAVAPNQQLQRTCYVFTPFAAAKALPIQQVVELRC